MGDSVLYGLLGRIHLLMRRAANRIIDIECSWRISKDYAREIVRVGVTTTTMSNPSSCAAACTVRRWRRWHPAAPPSHRREGRRPDLTPSACGQRRARPRPAPQALTSALSYGWSHPGRPGPTQGEAGLMRRSVTPMGSFASRPPVPAWFQNPDCGGASFFHGSSAVGIAPDEQIAIQTSRARHVIAMANAGAAKTTTLALRIAESITRGVWPGASSRCLLVRSGACAAGPG